MNLGDYPLGQTLDFHFTTRRFSTGAPFTLAGTPAVSAYEDNGTTEITAGITLTADFDSRTGLNHVRIVATGGNGFEAGKSYSLVITAGTVDGVSVVGEVVGFFTIERAAAYVRLGAPAGASVSADVAAIQADTDNIQTRLPAALVSGRMDASVGAMAADVVTASAIATDAIGAAEFAQAAADKVWGSAVRTLTSLGASLVQEVWDRATSALTTVGSIGKLLVDNIDASIGSRLASISYTTPPTAIENADALLDRNMATGADTNARSPRNALRSLRNKVSRDVGTGVITVTKEDDSTTAWTAASTADAAAQPVVSVDPA